MKTHLLTLAVAGLVMPAVAEVERQHGTHEHGAARLMVSTEGRELVIELDSPAFNIFGFEHRPSTESQQAVIDDALAKLNTGPELFGLNRGAGCSFEDSHVEARLLEHKEHGHEGEHHGDPVDKHHDEHAGEHHGEKHHDEAHHDDHADEHHDEAHHDEAHHNEAHHDEAHHDHGAEERAGHSDVRVEWHFECTDVSRLDQIEVKLFDFFPNLNDLDAQYITETGQGAAELSPRSTTLRF